MCVSLRQACKTGAWQVPPIKMARKLLEAGGSRGRDVLVDMGHGFDCTIMLLTVSVNYLFFPCVSVKVKYFGFLSAET